MTTPNHPDVLSLEDWVEQYKPRDAIENDGSGIPYAGAIKGPDEEAARAACQSAPGTVWTLISDDNGDRCIVEGFHFVNREAYVITEVAREHDNPMVIPVDYSLDDQVYSINLKDGGDDDLDHIRADSLDSARTEGAERFGVDEDEIEAILVSPSLNEEAGKTKAHRPRP